MPDRRQMAIKLNPHDRGRRDGDGIGVKGNQVRLGIERSERCGGATGRKVFEHIRHEIGSK